MTAPKVLPAVQKKLLLPYPLESFQRCPTVRQQRQLISAWTISHASTLIGDITENLMFKGSFHVSFGGNTWGGDVQCKFSDQSDIAKITEMNKGDIVNIRGVIEDHSFGTIDLEDCFISASQ